MPTVIDQPIVILSEGDADKNFLKGLVLERMKEDRCCFPFPNKAFYSASMFAKMLSAIKGDGVGYNQLKCVIIVADSCDDPLLTFDSIVNQIRDVGGFAIPDQIGLIAPNSDYPCVCVHTIPSNERPGGLESLFSDDFAIRHPIVTATANDFLSKVPAGQDNWNAEKFSKAQFATLVAATHRNDPSRAATFALRDPATIDLGSAAFAPIVGTLQATISAVLDC